tara:strand:+ start:1225 stop:2664 length:1440 start_codon:yes stop_codon:yes gene_type:complete
MRVLHFLRFPATCGAIGVLLAGCTVGPDFESPAVSGMTPASWRAGTGITSESPSQLGQWWKRLDDSTLNRLVSQAIERNHDVRFAESRVRQAIAARRATAGQLYPSLGTAHSATRLQSSSATTTSTLQPRVVESHAHGFESSWELDLFGGIRRSVEAADADIETSEEDLRNVLVSVISEVALNYVDYRSFQERLGIARSNLKSQLETLEFVRSRQQAGLAENLEVSQAVSNAENTRAQIPSLQTSATAAKNRLATLLGSAPGEVDSLLGTSPALPDVPTRIGVGIPAETIRRRPDVQAAERALAAETARTGVAIAELYPKFALNGSIGVEALKFSDLFSGGADVFNIGPSASWNLFRAGAVKANIEVQDAVQRQALISYEQSILVALEEVENALTALANQQIRERALAKSAEASATAAELARSQFEDGGLTSFLDVLDAERTRLSAEDSLATSQAQIVSNLIQLYRTLGGGWETVRPRG